MPFAFCNGRDAGVNPVRLDKPREEGICTLGVLVEEDVMARPGAMSVTPADRTDMVLTASHHGFLQALQCVDLEVVNGLALRWGSHAVNFCRRLCSLPPPDPLERRVGNRRSGKTILPLVCFKMPFQINAEFNERLPDLTVCLRHVNEAGELAKEERIVDGHHRFERRPLPHPVERHQSRIDCVEHGDRPVCRLNERLESHQDVEPVSVSWTSICVIV